MEQFYDEVTSMAERWNEITLTVIPADHPLIRASPAVERLHNWKVSLELSPEGVSDLAHQLRAKKDQRWLTAVLSSRS